MSENKKGSFWSYFFLVIITGLVGSVICAGIGVMCSKIFEIPETSFDNYGWRGFSVCLILNGIVFLLIGIMLVLEEGLSELFITLAMICLFTVIPTWFSVKYLQSEKNKGAEIKDDQE